VVSAQSKDGNWQLNHGPFVALPQLKAMHSQVTLAIRPASLRVEEKSGDMAISGQVQLAEISGTDTFVHFHCALGEWVMQKTGVHFFELGARLTFYFDPSESYVFSTDGALLSAPFSQEGWGA
jgi:glycerol transport system ATP-binding protein